ncbi:MAG: hypothetical protein IPM54_39730 [Polyangiaceae bacterium]|nr:hypothetical protein [Polyangiaceae bacterium]
MKSFSRHCAVGFVASIMFVAGCGGAQPQPSSSPPDGPAHLHHEGGTEPGEDHSKKVHPPLDEFRAVFAPIWHTESDSDRTSEACRMMTAIHAHAQKVEEGPVPEKATDQAAWKAEAHSFMEDVDALRKDCDVGREAVLPRLKSIHDGFHKLLDRAMGKLN